MKFSISGLGLAAVAALALMTSAGCGKSAPEQGGLRTSMIDASDRLESKDVAADVTPVGGASSVQVTETLHYINEPVFKHNTQYQIKRPVSATWVERVGFFVVHDNEGDWYSVHTGSPAASKLAAKPDPAPEELSRERAEATIPG